MRLAMKESLIKGAKASKRGPTISYLLFADDCILFGEATNKGARLLKGILKEYEECSSQCVNFNKSTIFYSSNTSEENKGEISAILGVRPPIDMEKYLGLPNVVGRRKKESFQNLKEKVHFRIKGWSNRFLSQGGKEVFIKSVLQTILAYAMSCFLLPNSLCGELERIIANFWWQKAHGKKGIHWCQWQLMCRPKDEGGICFRSWRIQNNPNSLVAQVLKAKYFLNEDFLNLRLGNNCSFTWKSICAVKGVLTDGLCWKVGRGSEISVLNDVWIPIIILLAKLIDESSRKWKEELIGSTFTEDVAVKILCIPLAKEPHDDILAWSESLGEFTVRSAYKLLQGIEIDPRAYVLQTDYRKFYKKLWLLNLPSKIKVTAWKISWNYLPIRFNMHHRKLSNNTICPRCGKEVETMNHLFRECPISKSVWEELSFSEFLKASHMEFIRIFCCALWAIWGERNKRIHEKVSRSGKEIANFIDSYILELNGIEVKIPKVPPEVKRWKHPPVGIVARDREGTVLLSYSVIHQQVASVFDAEAIACRIATQIDIDMQWPKLVIEGDALSIIKKCRIRSKDKSMIGAYIHSIQQLLAKIKRC
ncbi:reverse transcriptase [Gossypium australe]|uniref:Reverse transcriptase n=1 Tax=Gossypium australe TaxID=47621 RepID=A0A5B6WY10_9ROSI|nr:reverse transcriptase [Gossypium australe]